MFGDDIIDGPEPALRQLFDVYETYQQPVVALQQVPKNEVSSYGVIAGTDVGGGTWEVSRFVEKPKAEDAPSDLIAIGRYVLTPGLVAVLATQTAGKDGEMRLADAFAGYLAQGGRLYGHQFEGTRYDCGNKLGFLKAQVELGLKHPEVGAGLADYLRTRGK